MNLKVQNIVNILAVYGEYCFDYIYRLTQIMCTPRNDPQRQNEDSEC